MSRLFDISADFAELFDRFDAIDEAVEEMVFDVDIFGRPVDADGNIIDTERTKEEMRQAWFDTLTGIEEEFDTKAENMARYIKDSIAKSEAIEAESKKLHARSKAIANRAERFKQYLVQCMTQMSKKKVDGVMAKITLRNNAPSIRFDNEDAFIAYLQESGKDDLLKYKKLEIRKAEVKKLLKQGETFDGVRLEPSRSIIIS